MENYGHNILHLLLSGDGACCFAAGIQTGFMTCIESFHVEDVIRFKFRSLDFPSLPAWNVPTAIHESPGWTTDRRQTPSQQTAPRAQTDMHASTPGTPSPGPAGLQPPEWSWLSSADSWNHEK